MAVTDATFRASGLASGMDTTSMVDQLVTLESQPLVLLQKRQAGVQSQISALGVIVSKLQALDSAASSLGTDGVLAAKVTSSTTTFSATPGSGALSGRYAIGVTTLAQAAKWRSAAFPSASSTVGKGTLTLTVQGTTKTLEVAEGTSLADLAGAIRQTGLPVSATVLTGTKGTSITLTDQDTGLPASGAALDVQWTRDPTASAADPGFAEAQAATNAVFTVDGMEFTRQSNTVTDAIPGVTLTLNQPAATAGATEDLVLATDTDATRARLQTFVTAYNAVMGLLQTQLSPSENTDRGSTLAGDSTVRSLQGRLQAMLISKVAGLPGVSTLADVGVKTARDGSLSIDEKTFDAALSRDPTALDALFSTGSTGISAVVHSLVDTETRSGDGILSMHQASLGDTVKSMTDQEDTLQRRIDTYRQTLLAQFAAMESTVSSLKSIGNYLTQQENAANKGS